MIRGAESVESSPFRFCPSCGTGGGNWLGGHEYRCPACGFRFFQNVATACGVLIEHRGRFLFLERAKEPSKGLWGLAGGFVDPGESVDQALVREIEEEIAGAVGPLKFLGSFPNQYRFGGVTYPTCDLYFRASLAGDPGALRADPSEVAALRWLEPDEVDLDSLAFPS